MLWLTTVSTSFNIGAIKGSRGDVRLIEIKRILAEMRSGDKIIPLVAAQECTLLN